jgi:hypothetical protein
MHGCVRGPGTAPSAAEMIGMTDSSATRIPPLGLPRSNRRHAEARVWRTWLFAWVGAAVLGVLNGAFREAAYAERAGEGLANHISVATLIALLAVYVAALQRRRPLPTLRIALGVGAAWVALTVAFELGFGHWVAGESWAALAKNYDVLAGRSWVLVLVWIALGPAAIWALRGRRARPRE